MHPNSIFPRPIFIPKLIHIDTQFPELFRGSSSFLVPGNFFSSSRYQRLCEGAVENSDICIIDPVTNAFTYDGFLDKPTYQDLPYAPDQVVTALDFRSNAGFLSDFVGSVINFQTEHGAGILMAPYLFARDIDDGRFTVNLDLLSSTLQYVRDSNVEQPLFAMLNLGISCIENPRVLQLIVDQYQDSDVQGFFICIENFDDRVVRYEQLIGLARLCRTLSAHHDLIVSTIASFGQVLCALGINGFVGGVGWLETFREINLRSGREAFGAQGIPRARYYYVPELFSYVRPDDMEIIFDPQQCQSMVDYRCNCPICAQGLPQESRDKKTHFLHRRFEEMQELSDVSLDQRPHFMKERLELALALADDIEDEVLIRISTEHIVRWLNVLDLMSTPGAPGQEDAEESDNLDEIIHRARQNH